MWKLVYDEIALSAMSDTDREEMFRLIQEAESIIDRMNSRLTNKEATDGADVQQVRQADTGGAAEGAA